MSRLDGRRPRVYESWATPDIWAVPRWSTDDELWGRAFAPLATVESPAYEGVFLHRDFHLGNVLWLDSEISGVVDWVETSWGPAHLDVAHASTSLAMLHGPDSASAFEDAYYEAAGRNCDPADRYWNILDIVGFLPDPNKVLQPWRDTGIAFTDRTARARLEEHLRRCLDGATAGR